MSTHHEPSNEVSSIDDDQAPSPISSKGPLAWMARNTVAANLLMFLFVVGGFIMISRVKQEVFPDVDLDVVVVSVPYPGAAPTEVEQGIVLALEEEIRGIDEVKEVNATAAEGIAQIRVDLLLGTDPQSALQEIKSAVDGVTSLPQDAERATIALATRRREVISLVIYGEKSEAALRERAEALRNKIIDQTDVTVADIVGVRSPEISVEVPQRNLRAYGLTLDGIAAVIRQASVDVPGGSVKTSSGEVLLRTKERRELGSEFEDITVLSRSDGSTVRLRDIANVVDGFEESDNRAFFNGKPAVNIEIYRVGDQTPLDLAAQVKAFVEQENKTLPDGLAIQVWNDRSEIYRDRISLLLRNAGQGLILVLLVLGIFLEIRLAFWVTLGIPISFLGAILLMPATNVSLNMISLFAFILTLGIVVDDAIVVGEAVYNQRKKGLSGLEAAIAGAREVAIPVVFSVLTTVVAFSPLLFIPGVTGKFFINIPMIVIPILLLSLVESLLILPAHLSHVKDSINRGPLGALFRLQARFSEWFERVIDRVYRPAVKAALSYRYITLAIGAFCLMAAVGVFKGGLIKFDFIPKIEGDVIKVNVELPFGAPAAKTEQVMQEVLKDSEEIIESFGGRQHVRGVFAQLANSGSHTARISVFLTPPDQRTFTAGEFSKLWRSKSQNIVGLEKLNFDFTTGFRGGSPVDVELRHRDMKILEAAAQDLAVSLKDYDGVFEVDDGFSLGKEQLDFKLQPEARALGVTEEGLGRQLRNAFFGASAGRQQRGRDELRIFVRRPLDERQSEYDINSFLISTPDGGELPLAEAAHIERGRSFTRIERKDGRRLVHVTADVDIKKVSAGEVVESLKAGILPELVNNYPGLSYGFGGQQQSRAESLGALKTGFLFALIIMFGLMAVVFKSYVQPLIILVAIPFGAVGALVGHLLMGYNFSIISVMGLVALSGVVVNDSLVLMDAVNVYRKEGMTPWDAVIEAGVRRFRPILLTSLTTFFGLAPMITEQSVQARFLIPMALSLGFGVLFVTFIALVLVPALYLAIEDLRWLGHWIRNLYTGKEISAGVHYDE